MSGIISQIGARSKIVSGNVGIGGATMQTWDTGIKALHIGATSALADNAGYFSGYENAFLNASDDYVYITDGPASMFYTGNGVWNFRVSNHTGTAGQTIGGNDTWLDALYISNSGDARFAGDVTVSNASTHTELEIDALSASSHSPHLIFSKGGTQYFKMYREWSVGGLHIYDVTGGGGHQMTWLPGGNVGIGTTSPDAHLKVENTSINTDARFIGIYTNHTKDDGGSVSNDDFYGIRSDFVFNDGDAAHGVLIGVSTLAHNSNSADSNQIRGINAKAQLSGTSDVGDIYGSYILTDVDAGTVDSSVT